LRPPLANTTTDQIWQLAVAVDDEVRLWPTALAAVVVQSAVTHCAHPDRLGAGDVGAAQVADVYRLGGLRAKRGQGGFEDLRRGLVVADLVGESPAGEVAEQALAIEELAQQLATGEADVADDPEPEPAFAPPRGKGGCRARARAWRRGRQ
jgi:hypothetical protein